MNNGRKINSTDYSLSKHGISLLPVIEQLKDWGLKVKPQIEVIE